MCDFYSFTSFMFMLRRAPTSKLFLPSCTHACTHAAALPPSSSSPLKCVTRLHLHIWPSSNIETRFHSSGCCWLLIHLAVQTRMCACACVDEGVGTCVCVCVCVWECVLTGSARRGAEGRVLPLHWLSHRSLVTAGSAHLKHVRAVRSGPH